MSVGKLGEFMASVDEARVRQRWIPVDERLPEKEGLYLAVSRNEYDKPHVSVGLFLEGSFGSTTTHWMELPDLPEVTE